MQFSVSLTPFAESEMRSKAQAEESIEASRVIERGLKESRAIDLESLCVLPGRSVWHIFVDIRVVNDDGNALGAAGLAGLGAVCCFRRPDTSVNTDIPGGIVLHPTHERESVPLTMHFIPVPVVFSIFRESSQKSISDTVILDPNLKEEMTATGSVLTTITPQGDICAVQKSQGTGISPNDLMLLLNISRKISSDISNKLKESLESHNGARMAARVRRHTTGDKLSNSILIPDSTNLDGNNLDENRADKKVSLKELKDEEINISKKSHVGVSEDFKLPDQAVDDVCNSSEEKKCDKEIDREKMMFSTDAIGKSTEQAETNRKLQSEDDVSLMSTSDDNDPSEAINVELQEPEIKNFKSKIDEDQGRKKIEKYKLYKNQEENMDENRKRRKRTKRRKSFQRSQTDNATGDLFAEIGAIIADAGKNKIDQSKDDASLLASSLKK